MMKRLIMLILLLIMVACGSKEVKVEEEPVEIVELLMIREIDGLAYYKGELFTGRGETYEYGNIYERVDFKNGLKDGIARLYKPGYSENNKVVEKILKESIYKEGRLVEAKSWYINGEKKEEVILDNGNGIGKEYYQDGELKWEGTYVEGRLEGEKKYYYPSGKLYMIERYVDGKKEGIRESYYESGEKKYIGKYDKEELVEAEGWYINGMKALDKKENIIIEYDRYGKKKITTDLEKKIKTTHYPKRDEEEYLYEYRLNLGRTNDENESPIIVYRYNELGRLEKEITYNYNNDTKKIAKLFELREINYYDELGRMVYEGDEKYEYDGMGNKIGRYDLRNVSKDSEYYSETSYFSKREYDEKGREKLINYYDREGKLFDKYIVSWNGDVELLPGYRYEFKEGSKDYDYYRKYNGRLVEYGEMRYDEKERLIREEVYQGIIEGEPTKEQLWKANYYEYKYDGSKEVEVKWIGYDKGRFKERTEKVKKYDEQGRMLEEKLVGTTIENGKETGLKNHYEYGYDEEVLW